MSDMERTAKISWCTRYRYLLRRTWDPWFPNACIIMLNPSTADSYKDDATIRALIRLLKALGYGGFEVVNLFALRSTDPRVLSVATDPVGAMNDMYIVGAISRCDTVICAWGAAPFVVQSMRGVEVLEQIKHKTPMCFGTTKAGAPRHPLYLKTGTELEPYDG